MYTQGFTKDGNNLVTMYSIQDKGLFEVWLGDKLVVESDDIQAAVSVYNECNPREKLTLSE